MMSPEEVKNKRLIERFNLEQICMEIDEELIKTSFEYENRLEIILKQEYPKIIRDKIAELYIEKGWSKVKHKTSSENDERAGLTEFEFYY